MAEKAVRAGDGVGEEILQLTQEQLAELKKGFLQGNKLLEESYVRVTDDKMEAWIYLARPQEGTVYKTEDLIEMLRSEGVTTGYILPRLTAISKKGVYEREILAAKGKAVVEGRDGYYEYFFTPDELAEAVPEIREDGSVDYSSMSALQNVQIGDLLAEYHPAVAGEDGYRIDGEELKSIPVKELQPLRGLSIERKGGSYYAAAAGKIEMKKGNIDIRTLHEIPGDVDLSIGKIEFFGDITIGGNVTAGVVIRAGRNLIIEGTVESADLFAGGDIMLKRGIQGNMKGKVRCRGSVYANFIEQCDVRADKNIEANYILNANVKAENKIFVKGKKGSIIGGQTQALQGIEAYQLGNAVEVRTVVHAGYEKEVFDRYMSCAEKEKELEEKLSDVLERMQELIKRKQFQSAVDTSSLLMLNGKKDEYYKKLDEVREEMADYKERIEKGKGAKINAEGMTYRGVLLSIDGCCKQAKGGISYVTYCCKQGEIQSETFRRMSR